MSAVPTPPCAGGTPPGTAPGPVPSGPVPWDPGGLVWRVPTVLAGLGCLAAGAALLLGGRSTDPASALAWLLGVLVAHDAVLGPLGAGAAWLVVRLTRRRRGVGRAVAGGLFVAVCLVLVAVPALFTPGVAGNPTATPRNYGAGLAAALAAVAIATVAIATAATAGAAVHPESRRRAGRWRRASQERRADRDRRAVRWRRADRDRRESRERRAGRWRRAGRAGRPH